jgi:hypothetical protein
MEFIKRFKRNLETPLRAFGATLLVAAMLGAAVAGQTIRRVKFDYGRSSVTFSGEVGIGQKDIYLIRLKKEQTIEIEIFWEGEDITNEPRPLTGYMIVYPNGEKVIDPPGGTLQPTAAGNYKIIVAPRIERTDYRYRLVFTRY